MTRSNEETHVPQIENQWYDDWIKENVPDLTGKVAIITGCNSGTGFWAASALAGKGCTVVMACRSVDKATSAKNDILKEYPDAKLDVIRMDNMDLSTVRSFAKTFNEKYDRLDFLLNNAGIMAQPLIESKDGYDIQWQTNHLAHFLLTKLVWDKLVATEGQSRVVNHSSAAHSMGAPKFDKDHMDLPPYSLGFLGFNVLLYNAFAPVMGFKPVDRWRRYGMSKLCNILMMRQLQSKIDDPDTKPTTDNVICVACHPGYASTGLQHGASDAMSNWEKHNENNAQSAADGSLPLLMATLSVQVNNGDYLGPREGMKGPPHKDKVGGNGNDKAMAASLWEYSEQCIGEKFEV